MSDNVSNERIFDPTTYFLGRNRIEGLEQPSDVFHHILHRDKALGLSRLVFNNLKAKRKVDRTLVLDTSSLMVAVDGAVHTQLLPQPPTPRDDGSTSTSKDGFHMLLDTVETPGLVKSGIRILPLRNVDADLRTRATYGIYFGAGSVHNMSGLVPPLLTGNGTVPTKETAILRGCTVLLTYILDTFASSQSCISALPLTKIVILTSSTYLTKCLSSYVHVWEKNGYMDSRGMFVENSRELRELESVVRRCESEGLNVCLWLFEEGKVGKEGIGGLSEARVLADEMVIREEEEIGTGESD